jgi:hypothetical protein
VLDHLKLPQPLSYSEDLRLLIIESLEESGRFRSVAVSPEIPFGPGQAVPLFVRVVEFEEVPPLNESLTPEQEAAVRLSHWLNHWHESGDDLVIHVVLYPGQLSEESLDSVFGFKRFLAQMAFGDPSVQEANAELVLCPAGGGLLRMQSRSSQGKPQPRRTLIVSKDLSGIHFENTDRAFRTGPLESGCTLAISLQSLLNGGALDSSYHAGFQFDSGRRPELGLGLLFPPSAVLAETEHLQILPQDDRIMVGRFHSESTIVEFERETGRLVRMYFGNEDLHVTVETRPGAIAQELPAVVDLFAGAPIHQESDALVELGRLLMLQYAAELTSSGHPDDGAVMAKLLESSAWNKLVSDLSATSPADHFIIPAPGATVTGGDNSLSGRAMAAYGHVQSTVTDRRLTPRELTPGANLSDDEIVKLLAGFFSESPELDAISRFLVSYVRSLTDSEARRLGEIIEQGEIFGFGKGLNVRPLLILTRSDVTDDPVLIRERVLAFTWQTWLKHHVRHWVVDDGNGGIQLRWEFGNPSAGTTDDLSELFPDTNSTPVKSISDTNPLGNIIDEELLKKDWDINRIAPEELFNRYRESQIDQPDSN